MLDKQMLEYNLKQIDSQADLDDAAKAAVCAESEVVKSAYPVDAG